MTGSDYTMHRIHQQTLTRGTSMRAEKADVVLKYTKRDPYAVHITLCAPNSEKWVIDRQSLSNGMMVPVNAQFEGAAIEIHPNISHETCCTVVHWMDPAKRDEYVCLDLDREQVDRFLHATSMCVPWNCEDAIVREQLDAELDKLAA